ncbi:MAG: ParA family protein [Treponema sp.]|nr:ParA family protein [Treponema sp.]
MGEKTFKTFCVFMQKGGVGKTTLTTMLSYELTRFGKVLIVDADQQGNLTYLYDPEGKLISETKCFLSVLKDETNLEDAIITCREPTDISKGLYLLGTKKNDNDLRSYMESGFRDDPHSIRTLVKRAEELGFAYVFFDLPPSFGYYEKIILANATDIIPIIEPEDFAVESLTNFNTQIKKLKITYDAKFSNCKYLVVNKGNNKKQVHKFWTETLKQSPYEIFEFHDSKAVSGAISYHLPMQEYNPGNPLCKTITELAEKVK